MVTGRFLESVEGYVNAYLPIYRPFAKGKIIGRLEALTDRENFWKIAHDVSVVVKYAQSASVVSRLLDLIEEEYSPEIISGMVELSQVLQNTKVNKAFKLVKKYGNTPQSAKIVDVAHRVATITYRNTLFSEFCHLCSLFELEKYEHHIVDELADYCHEMIARMSRFNYAGWRVREVRKDVKKMAGVIKEESAFLSKLDSSTLFPTIRILYDLGEEYAPMIKQLDKIGGRNLGRAYSIARNNVDEDGGENYLPQFYDGLKECVEKRPDDLGKWAASIVSDFRKKGGEGLLMEVEG